MSSPIDETYLTTKDFKERFKASESKQAKDRKDGSGPPFVKRGNQVLYPLSLALKYFADKIVNCNADLAEEQRVVRNKRLAEARAKARVVLDAKYAEKVKGKLS